MMVGQGREAFLAFGRLQTRGILEVVEFGIITFPSAWPIPLLLFDLK